jgi:hypothetical protein
VRPFLLLIDRNENSEAAGLICVKIHYFTLNRGQVNFHLQSSFDLRCGYEMKLFVKMAVFWVIAPCRLVEVYRRFRGACCLNHHGALKRR